MMVSRKTLMPGIKVVPEVSVRLVKDREIPYNGLRLGTPGAVAEFLQFDHDQDRERFYVLMLSARRTLVAFSVVAMGTLDAVAITPRELFKAAILHNAYCVILAHNHPSGDPSPSEDDLEVTGRFVEAGHVLGIPVVDHIVFAERGSYVSIRESWPGCFGGHYRGNQQDGRGLSAPRAPVLRIASIPVVLPGSIQIDGEEARHG